MKTTIKSFWAICTVLLLSSCADKSLMVQITNHTEDYDVVLVGYDAEEQEVVMDGSGVGTLSLKDRKKGYASLYYGPYYRLIWIDPNSNLGIGFDGTTFANEVTFEGPTAQINDYLNKSDLQEIMIDDCKLDEPAFIAKADSLLRENLRKLDEAQLPSQFVDREKKRLTYFTYSAFAFYPEFYPRFSGDTTYAVSKVYLDKLRELWVMDASCLDIKEYTDFLKNAIPLLARGEFPELSPAIDRNIAFVEKNMDNGPIAEYAIHSYIYAYIKRNGLDDSDKYRETYNRLVKDPQRKKSMEELIRKWERIRVGNLSPDFMATDINGKKYALADFKGKYVYIDVWATWCGPCKKEAPFLQELEQLYKEKDIYIVSLSCDADRGAWEKDMIKENKEGIQIILEANSSFLDDYMIIGIPHFLMLDSEGKILNSQMLRPSDPATRIYLDSLLNNQEPGISMSIR